MACDIHTQVYRKDEGHHHGWVPIEYHEPPSRRHYPLFAALAGVRDYAGVDPWFADRGKPAGHYDDWDEDGHSYTFATFAELLAADWDGAGLRDSTFCRWLHGEGEWGSEVAAMIAHWGGADRLRLVIWFDN